MQNFAEIARTADIKVTSQMQPPGQSSVPVAQIMQEYAAFALHLSATPNAAQRLGKFSRMVVSCSFALVPKSVSCSCMRWFLRRLMQVAELVSFQAFGEHLRSAAAEA